MKEYEARCPLLSGAVKERLNQGGEPLETELSRQVEFAGATIRKRREELKRITDDGTREAAESELLAARELHGATAHCNCEAIAAGFRRPRLVRLGGATRSGADLERYRPQRRGTCPCLQRGENASLNPRTRQPDTANGVSLADKSKKQSPIGSPARQRFAFDKCPSLPEQRRSRILQVGLQSPTLGTGPK